MCRIAAFPPGFPRNEALEICANFENSNTDGTGSAYIKDGKFVVDKWAKPFSKIARRNNFLGHMPYTDSWTIAHLRAASHGGNRKENTHPFLVGNWAFIHNGIWNDHNLVRLALSKQVTMEGETDSEVAAHLWNIVGPKKFSEAIDFGGVFMGLHRSGKLWVVKTSGDLEIKALKRKQILLASELNEKKYDNRVDGVQGWYLFDEKGCYIKHKENKDAWSSGYPYRGSHCFESGSRSKARVTSGISDHTEHVYNYVPGNQHVTYYGGHCE